jgi:RNA polymerase sigma factor for flagellar operon FliA
MLSCQNEINSIDVLWREYKNSGLLNLRNELVLFYMTLVRYGAMRVWVKTKGNFEMDDFMSWGIGGLIDSIETFELERGVKFITYCHSKIRGAIIDEIRERDWVPRIVRNRNRRVMDVSADFYQNYGYYPNDEEMAKFLQMLPAEFDKIIRDSFISSVLRIKDDILDSDSEKTMTRYDLPILTLLKKEFKQIVMDGMSRQERLVVLLYYFEDLTMKEIGRVLDVSESRVCQIHSKIILDIRKKAMIQSYCSC